MVDLPLATGEAVNGRPLSVVFAAPEGEKLTDPDNRAAVTASAAKAGKAEEVSLVVDPFKAKAISPDGRIGFADVVYPVPADEIDEHARDELEDVPAVMALLGRSAWKLPRRLERAMPDVDIEGEKLLETLHPARP